jgi:hypothetical protein
MGIYGSTLKLFRFCNCSIRAATTKTSEPQQKKGTTDMGEVVEGTGFAQQIK